CPLFTIATLCAVEGEVGKVVQGLGQVKTEDAIKQALTDLHTQLPAIKDLTDAEADVLLVTHTTIASVSDCLENSPYGLNTVISDLTKFTNALASSPLTNVKEGAELSASSQKVLYVATTALLRLLAPIAPALAEECWSHLHAPLLSSSAAASGPSVFAAPWPAPILTPEQVSQLSTRGAQTTAVQINGKLRFSVEIPRFNGDGRDKEAEKEWVVNKVLETKEGKRWLVEKNEWEKRRKVVVVKGGRVLSVVF
ncbi:Leucyl-tRNA synthetase, mitochondrial, partial [Ascosphaera atra]